MTICAAPVFSSHMVLQRNTPIPIWGQSETDSPVYCFLSNNSGGDETKVCTRSDGDGHWFIHLPSQTAGGPYCLTLRCGESAQQFTDVYIGDVWLAGGQSNMELSLIDSQDGKRAVAACDDPRLHFYETPKVTTTEQAKKAQSSWKTISPETAAGVSAVAYYAARQIARSENIHVGILECFWGGTFAHCWMPRSYLAQFPEGRERIAWYNAQIGEKTDEEFDAECKEYQTRVDAWNRRISARRTEQPDVSWAILNEECGLYPWPPPAGRTAYQRPGNLYESMLRQICPYAIRGFWYYQGCQDELWAQDYAALLRHLVHRWRADWNDERNELPFLIVQLPMFGSGIPGSWPTIRAAQSTVSHTEPNAGLVVLSDCGEVDNIHPTDKLTPGRRLGLLALDMVYHRSVTGRSPELASVFYRGKTVTVRFSQIGGALTLDDKREGFQLSDSSGVFHNAEARLISSDTVELFCPELIAPTAVRYAWENYCHADLHGGTGLAAAPFFNIKGE